MSVSKRAISLVAAVLLALHAGAAGEKPRVFLFNPDRLVEIRGKIQSGSHAYDIPLKRLFNDADAALRTEPLSVVDKKPVPPSGDKHDYMSMAPYWWPDSAKGDGLPYVQHDGEINPERDEYPDHAAFGKLEWSVSTLALAYFYGGGDRYAEHAATLLRVWFVDTATAMNPNLNYAQAVRGKDTGRGYGIIETHLFPELLDAVGMLDASPAWTVNDRQAFRTWCGKYFTWLRESPHGKKERLTDNNHGTWYDTQVATLALFLGETNIARQVCEESKALRVTAQIEPDGAQPRELRRTKAMGYCTFNLTALEALADIARSAGVDLWNFRTADGRCIRAAVDWMLPFYTGEKEWAHKQIKPFDPAGGRNVLLQASVQFGEKYREAAQKVDGGIPPSDRIHLTL